MLSSFRAPTLWFIDLTVATMPYSIQFSEFIQKKFIHTCIHALCLIKQVEVLAAISLCGPVKSDEKTGETQKYLK